MSENEATVTFVITKVVTIKPWEVADALGGSPSDDEIREYLESASDDEIGTSAMHISFNGEESFEDSVRRASDRIHSGDDQ